MEYTYYPLLLSERKATLVKQIIIKSQNHSFLPYGLVNTNFLLSHHSLVPVCPIGSKLLPIVLVPRTGF